MERMDRIKSTETTEPMIPLSTINVNTHMNFGDTLSKESDKSLEFEIEVTQGQEKEKLAKDLKKSRPDVQFLVGEKNEIVVGKRKCLGSVSPVFHAMFNGGLANVGEEPITLPDCDPECFRAIIEYSYTEKLPELSIFDKPSEMLYTARKYQIQALEVKTSHFLMSTITYLNAVEVYDLGSRFDLPDLKGAAWDYLINGKHLEHVLIYSWKKPMESDLLLSLLKDDTLQVACEADLFLSICTWAGKMCNTRGLEGTPENIRSILSDMIYYIRIPLMSVEEISTYVARTKILTKAELADIFVFKLTNSEAFRPPIPFLHHPRETSSARANFNSTASHVDADNTCCSALINHASYSPTSTSSSSSNNSHTMSEEEDE